MIGCGVNKYAVIETRGKRKQTNKVKMVKRKDGILGYIQRMKLDWVAAACHIK